MRITEKRAVQKEVTARTICDGCGKTVDGDAPVSWEHFMSGHGEWGNDSCESVEWHDACSMTCFVKVAREVVERFFAWEQGTCPSLEVGGLNIAFLKDLFLMADGKI